MDNFTGVVLPSEWFDSDKTSRTGVCTVGLVVWTFSERSPGFIFSIWSLVVNLVLVLTYSFIKQIL